MSESTVETSEAPDLVSSRRPYESPVLTHFGAVTELTNSAVGTCKDDSETNICPPNKLMQMQDTTGN